VFPRNTHKGDQEHRPSHHDYSNCYTSSNSNFTPEGLVKFMDVAIASKYGNDLTNFTSTITEEVHSTLETFTTNPLNMLPQQIGSVVQQVHGGS
jgi:hypothetical protein